MGVNYDYFRAPDDASAARVLTRPRDSSTAAFDMVATKWIDPAVVLGKLVALVRDEPWDVDLVSLRPCGDGAAPDGPVLCECGQDLRDTLADVTDGRVAGLAAEWAVVEELSSMPGPAGNLVELVVDLVALARRARDARERLYVLMTL